MKVHVLYLDYDYEGCSAPEAVFADGPDLAERLMKWFLPAANIEKSDIQCLIDTGKVDDGYTVMILEEMEVI